MNLSKEEKWLAVAYGTLALTYVVLLSIKIKHALKKH